MVNSAPEGSFRQDTGSLDSLYRHFTVLKLQLKAENTPLFLAATCRHPALSHQIGCYSTLRPLARQLCICPRNCINRKLPPLDPFRGRGIVAQTARRHRFHNEAPVDAAGDFVSPKGIGSVCVGSLMPFDNGERHVPSFGYPAVQMQPRCWLRLQLRLPRMFCLH